MIGIKQVREGLSEYPEIEYKSTDLDIVVPPKFGRGFEVKMTVHADGVVVFYDGWHQSFSDVEAALPCFLIGLSPLCKIKVTERGGTRYKWRMEYLDDDGKWVKTLPTSHINFSILKQKSEYYLQNEIIGDRGKIEEIIGTICHSSEE